MSSTYGSINPELLGLAKQNLKKAFVAAGDPAMDPAAAAGGAPPMDPMAAGGAPPMDPMAAGGAPPMDPAMMDPMAQLQPTIDQSVQAALAAQGGGAAGGGGGAPKAKKFDPEEIDRRLFAIDTNLAKIADALGVTLSPSDVVTPPAGETGPTQDVPPEAAPVDPMMAGGPSAINPPSPISPMGAAVPKQAAWENGHAETAPSDEAINNLEQAANVASAWLRMANAKG